MTTKLLKFTLEGTPYSLGKEAWVNLTAEVKRIEEDTSLLRKKKELTEETLREYYGEKRYEQVCESNALEGSTLDIGETEMAVLKGVTLTGHDPAYVRDARALDKALTRLAELAKTKTPTDIEQVKELHSLIKEGQSGAGMFRKDPVIIRGSQHTPPKTWNEVMTQMEQWEAWSKSHQETSAIIRATILHAWFTNIHPFSDGNGRTARAISNLELIRAGIPPIIIKKTERMRYINALGESDHAGDLGPFFQLMLDRVRGALTGLEIVARKREGFDKVAERVRQAQQRQLTIWNTAVKLYFDVLVDMLAQYADKCGGRLSYSYFEHSLDLDDYIRLANGKAIGTQSWNFEIILSAPGLKPVRRLCWTGFTPVELREAMKLQDGFSPALFWSRPNPAKFPPWINVDAQTSPGVLSMAIRQAGGDSWFAQTPNGNVSQYTTRKLAETVVNGFVRLLTEQP